MMKTMTLFALLLFAVPAFAQDDAKDKAQLNAASIAFMAAGVADTATTIWMGPGHQYPIGYQGWRTHEADPLVAWYVNKYPNLLYAGPAIDLGIVLAVRRFAAPNHPKLAKVILWTGAVVHGSLVPSNLVAGLQASRNERAFVLSFNKGLR